MKRTLFTILISIALGLNTAAQDKLFTASDYLNRELSPKSITGLSWRTGLDAFTWIENNCLIQKTIKNPALADTILKLESLNSKLREFKQNELRQFPSISWTGSNSFYFRDQNGIFLYDLSASKLTKVNEFDSSGENMTISGKSFNVAWTVGNNLFVALNGETIQVNSGENQDIVSHDRLFERQPLLAGFPASRQTVDPRTLNHPVTLSRSRVAGRTS